VAALALALGGCADGDPVEPDSGGGGAAATTNGNGGIGDGSGGHGCFFTEATCDGACVKLDSHPEHCGECNHPCASGECVEGECVGSACPEGFQDDGGTCKNLLGAHESWPADCAGCNVANVISGSCACPPGATDLALHVQSDCPGVPMRFATELRMCVTAGVSADVDFGGAYQMDDADGLCGATAQCRVGNPLNGNACACPAGFDEAISLRSILRLPCDGTEFGSTVVLCGNIDAPLASFGGAYQLDDIAPQCRVTNPWTGDCSCPAGTTDHSYRIMVDGAAGLYGSTAHVCMP